MNLAQQNLFKEYKSNNAFIKDFNSEIFNSNHTLAFKKREFLESLKKVKTLTISDIQNHPCDMVAVNL